MAVMNDSKAVPSLDGMPCHARAMTSFSFGQNTGKLKEVGFLETQFIGK